MRWVYLYQGTQFSIKKKNRYNVTAYKSICAEFGIDPNSDFRFTGDQNNGLGSVYIWMRGPTSTNFKYPGDYKFSDEGGKAEDGDVIYYIRPKPEKKYEYFVTPVSYGLTQAGQARINQSIECFTYSILGSQVDLRSTILGDTGSAIEVQREFMNIFESSIINNNLSKSVERFQLSIKESKVKLDLTISPGTWLTASNLILNTESKISYNSYLRHATPSMHLGLNSDVNKQTKITGIKHNLGESRVKLLSHKAPRVKNISAQRTKDTETQPTRKDLSVTKKPEIATKQSEAQNKGQSAASEVLSKSMSKKTKTPPSHEISLAVMTVLAGAFGYLLFKT